MDREMFIGIARQCFYESEDNAVYLPKEAVSLPILEEPLVGFAAADDPIFETFRRKEVIGSNWRAPQEWMPEARTAAALFFPFTEDIRCRHRASKEPANDAWSISYGKHFQFMEAFLSRMSEALRKEDVKTCCPTRDSAFTRTPVPVKSGEEDDLHYDTSWSNRHVAFAAGLGTFGIHRHLITEKGCCGALATMILDCAIEPTPRPYRDTYEYCIRCGACARRCPAGAITLEHLRNIRICGEHGARLFQEYRGACGKCLVGLPCEHRNPSSKKDRMKSEDEPGRMDQSDQLDQRHVKAD